QLARGQAARLQFGDDAVPESVVVVRVDDGLPGDDGAAKESVAALLDRLGYDTVDVGATTESWRIQEGSPAYVLPYLSDPRLPFFRDPGKRADTKEIRAALEQARIRP
ncbi:hypothetical protein PV369_15520, partial [Streptomyces scabiei]|nr:hypothetical protein [Streptomyces scabiei]